MENITIVSILSGVRLDVYLADFLNLTRSNCTKLINNNSVYVNSRKCKPSYKVSEGDKIIVTLPVPEPEILKPQKLDVEVILDAKNYCVINKPAGMVVHPATGNYENTAVNWLICKYNVKDADDLRPGVVHRLDKDTSGLLIMAKDQNTKELFAKMFKERNIVKKYSAICYGRPDWDEVVVEKPIRRHPVNRKKMFVSNEQGRHAKTKVSVLERFKNAFLADVTIYTGRTHQIRVHACFMNHPVIGDKLYNNKSSLKFPVGRQALHASYLEFADPFSGKIITLSSDIPMDMKKLLEYLRGY